MAEYGDVSDVLRDLRERTFASGDFYREPAVPPPAANAAEYMDTVISWMDGSSGINPYRASWSGAYIVAYTDDVPSHLCFTGFSGD